MEDLEEDGLVSAPWLSVVVPVRDEAMVLPVTAPALLAAAEGANARIVWVCNGCVDGSAELIRKLAPGAELIELSDPGKTAALQAADDLLGDLFPRIYLDADVRLAPGDLVRLTAPLLDGGADLVGPVHAFDTSGAAALSRMIADCWVALPHARENGFIGALGVSTGGRACWGRFPDVIGDDIFMSAMIAPDRRRIVPQVVAVSQAPRDFFGWVRMRARWRRGEIELARLGIRPPAAPTQRAALLSRLLRPRTAPGALAFVAARLLAEAMARGRMFDRQWRPDRRSASLRVARPRDVAVNERAGG